MEKLLFECQLAPGDNVVLSAVIDDLNKAYPGKFSCNVWNGRGQAFPAIWENNPFIDSSIKPGKATRVITPHYHDEMRESNEKQNMHFTEAMTRNISAQLEMPIVSHKRPVLYLTDQEKSSRPIPEPYWVMMAGGKNDITTKWWSTAYWQKLIQMLPEIKFVQLGAADKEHWNPELKQVVNMVGRTTLRELILYIYHSEGVVCGVTCGMHIAAAFKKPCVVIAGGREGSWWEKYPEQTYLHTVGMLPCCIKPCWKSHIAPSYIPASIENRQEKLCQSIVKKEQLLPKCMESITPNTVALSIRSYSKPAPLEFRQRLSNFVPSDSEIKLLGSLSICVCLYGTDSESPTVQTKDGTLMSYHQMHVRCLSSILSETKKNLQIQLILGCNSVDPKTMTWIRANMPGAVIIEEKRNINKYPMMRKIFSKVATDWIMWLDDDTHFTKSGWLTALYAILASGHGDVYGKLYHWNLLEGQLNWVQEATWFRGLAPMISVDGNLVVSFTTGGFQLIRTKVVRDLDWPDPRLDHCGGDVMFGEACRQAEYATLPLNLEQLGICISDASRRGTNQRSAGSTTMSPMTVKMLSKCKFAYITEHEIFKMIQSGFVYELFPDTAVQEKEHRVQLAEIEIARNNLASVKPGCCEASARQQTFSKLTNKLLSEFLPRFQSMDDEKKNKLLTYVRKEYNSKAETVYCMRLGRLVSEKLLMGA
jgi:hypothetical protein